MLESEAFDRLQLPISFYYHNIHEREISRSRGGNQSVIRPAQTTANDRSNMLQTIVSLGERNQRKDDRPERTFDSVYACVATPEGNSDLPCLLACAEKAHRRLRHRRRSFVRCRSRSRNALKWGACHAGPARALFSFSSRTRKAVSQRLCPRGNRPGATLPPRVSMRGGSAPSFWASRTWAPGLLQPSARLSSAAGRPASRCCLGGVPAVPAAAASA